MIWPFRRRARLTRHCERTQDVSISVVVPVLNAGTDLAALLAAIKEQTGFRAIETVVVDSGSTDGSVAAAEQHGASMVHLAPADFSHSHARNLGAEAARGDYLLFTVQDARPESPRWLQEMFAGLVRHGAAAVTCGERPRPDADLFYRAISWQHHRFMSVDGGDRVLERGKNDDAMARRRSGGLSDTACLIGRALFLRYRHRGAYAEDLDLGLRLVDDGLRLAFLSGPRIVHSHNRPAYYHLRRGYVEHLALLDMVKGYPAAPGDLPTAARDVLGWLRGVDALLAGPLGTLGPPLSARTVHAALAMAVAAPLPAGDWVASRAALDASSTAFVERLLAVAPGIDAGAEGALALGLSEVMCDYLEHGPFSFDAALLDEFKAGLYKGWALHAGVRLASARWNAPASEWALFAPLHDELTKGV